MCAVALNGPLRPPWAVMLQTVSALSQNSGAENATVSAAEGVTVMIVSGTCVDFRVVM